jgi:formylglycine-generating enzyme required for sulfatase activity
MVITGIAGWSDDGADITNAVKKYPANDFGLYDMAGNVRMGCRCLQTL